MKWPHFHATADDVEPDHRMKRIELDTMLSHWFAWGLGGKLAGLYEAWWKDFARTSQEREQDLHRFRPAIPWYRFGYPIQCGTGNHGYQACGSTPPNTNFTVHAKSV